MAHVIAVAGKGGVGKTTLCGLLIQYLCESGKGPVLAVDADANSNLNEVLGVEVEATLGDIREEIARAEMASKNPIPAGMSKADYAEFKFAGALTEEDDFDLLVMGRTQEKAATASSMDFCRISLQSCIRITPSWLWITRQAWSISAVVYFREWIQLFWSVTAQEEEYRPLRESRS